LKIYHKTVISNFLFSILIVLCLRANCSAEKLDTSIISPNLYVAPNGDDNNPGTQTEPFATLQRAQRVVREFKERVPKPITVFVREGTYYLSKPIVFTPADSGTDLQPVTYTAYPGEKPTISGGVRLQVKWEPYRDGIMKCSVPKGIDFDQLFINGKRQIRARYPNYDFENPLVKGKGYINTSGGGGKEFTYNPETFTKKRWDKPSEAIVHIFPGTYWYNLQFHLKAVDRDRNIVVLGEGGWQKRNLNAPSSFSESSRFFIENVFEELDVLNEWYLDKQTSILYYKPPQGMNLSDARIEVGLLKQLIEFKGSRAKPVSHIQLKGFRFTHTATTFLDKFETPSTGDWGIHRGGALFFEGAEDCSVENSFFDAVGGNAVFINNHNRRIKVYGNKFTNIGDSAVCLVGRSFVDMSKPMVCSLCGAKGRWSFGPDPEDYPTYCTISNNLMHHLGVYGKQTAGVFMAVTLKNKISHNHIYYVPRAAICINDPFWGGHVIEYNDIHDTVLETEDHGPFNSWGRGRVWCVRHAHGLGDPERICHEPGDVKTSAKFTTIVRNNRFRDKSKIALGEYGNYGIDMDDGSANYHVYNNLCIGVGVQNRDGSYRLVENNIFINPQSSISYHVGHVNNHDKFVRNIVVISPKLDHFGNHSGNFYQMLYPPDKGQLISQVDYNVLYNDSRPIVATEDYSFEEWQEHGLDTHSVIGDPMFVDPDNGDYHVKPESIALKLGFENFDMDKFGLLPDFPDKWSK